MKRKLLISISFFVLIMPISLQAASIKAGQAVEVYDSCTKRWWKGHVLEVNKTGYYVKYIGEGEWINKDEIRVHSEIGETK